MCDYCDGSLDASVLRDSFHCCGLGIVQEPDDIEALYKVFSDNRDKARQEMGYMPATICLSDAETRSAAMKLGFKRRLMKLSDGRELRLYLTPEAKRWRSK